MSATPASTVSMTSLEVRDRLVEALKLDLVGPWPDHDLAEELLPGWVRPSNWYLTGFLIPVGTSPEKSADADEDDDFDLVPESAGLAEESTEERKAAKKGFFPSSMGLSFLVPKEAQTISVTVCWADYALKEIPGADGKPLSVWQRMPRESRVEVALKGSRNPILRDVPESNGLQLHIVERLISLEELEQQIPRGSRSVSVFLVNHRTPNEASPDISYVFQAEIVVRGEYPFVARPDLRGAKAAQWDDQVADLHYADAPEYATGHGVSAGWEIEGGACRMLNTAWIPSAEVEKTVTVDVPGAELSMEALGALAGGAAAEVALRPLVREYRAWIETEGSAVAKLHGGRSETARELLRCAGIAADRIERGIALLGRDEDALDAFRMANRAVSRALRKRLGIENPSWRAFQLAFLLLNLPGLADLTDANRATVDLLFFPTGGGKTEAYLGLAAFAMVMRRLRHRGEKGLLGAGVSVIMRYTLRLLTLDQLARAAGLVCALELERENDVARYGEWPFEIGLWVGKAATPNILGHKGDGRSDSARTKVRQFKADPKGKPSPIPLENCPWCGTRFGPDSFALLPNDDQPRELRIVCTNFECEFTRDRPLPIVAVDEPIYRRLPAFLIATVDKFASLPWVGQAGVLLGGADRHDSIGFYGAAEPRRGTRLSKSIPPPDLVIQDELHLISGPLGTMAGLYETAIEALCTGEIGGRAIRPKIVASTATVRRAQDQIQALFA
ncbi:MAG: helicase, partial [Acidobacteriaceae bacterium]